MLTYTNDTPHGGIRAVLFDFDGTLSTLRSGWETVMRPLMLEMIAGETPVTGAMETEVDAYIDASTGIQTIFQMEWLRERVKAYGLNPNAPDDPWRYKDIYNERLMRMVDMRKAALERGSAKPDDFLIDGSVALLKAFRAAGLTLFVASGTDDADVVREATLLGVAQYFSRIAGAPYRSAQCSKEAVLRDLLQTSGYRGGQVLVLGDGKVEIALGREIGAWTIGIASDEQLRCGINPIKKRRLENAGAHAITGDFRNLRSILDWMEI